MEREKISSFRDLQIWQKGMNIARVAYRLTRSLPKEETFGLISQIRRAAVSIPSNIAEGRSRSSRKDFCQFLHIAMGSLSELETQLILVSELYKIKIDAIIKDIHEEQRMTMSMLSKLKAVVPKS